MDFGTRQHGVEEAADASLFIVKCDAETRAQSMGDDEGGWLGADLQIGHPDDDGWHLIGYGIEGKSH